MVGALPTFRQIDLSNSCRATSIWYLVIWQFIKHGEVIYDLQLRNGSEKSKLDPSKIILCFQNKPKGQLEEYLNFDDSLSSVLSEYFAF
jgi:hypothetical protein